MKDRILKKMYELSDGSTRLLSFNCNLYPEFREDISEIEFRKFLKDLEAEGLVEIISGFSNYTMTLNDLSLLNLTKEGIEYTSVLGGDNTFKDIKNSVLKTISVLAGGKPFYQIDARSELYPVFKNKINEDRLNNLLIQLNHDNLISAKVKHFKGVPYVTSFTITVSGLSSLENILDKSN